ncbi:hypothetical protein HYPSUDRAFT_61328 [Hypholoma sublateritium FD-334 SS-4]|uniref:Las1-like protein n=1 Tax=Hypholoma sublateritium (strain FD-334 SS-4) TaxID=945553 RepID=A0A0D2MYX8_HYPSF|nr:hypothetical protein HYPSUDRAFT_61328 [Hypholoma sublateritium FD-334 SS-4]
MRLPRRVPWASLAELEQLCACIYTDEADLAAKVAAIHRLAAWRAITALPHALDSVHALLAAIVQDSAQPPAPAALAVRHAYAAAVIRLVNGLVDPLQAGAFARPITAIAQQLGLPAWLVELRHAATHEDLPSLELLREAARQAMAWLLHNYFLPTLHPVAAPAQEAAPLRPLAPLLVVYKGTMKLVTRDVSMAAQYRPRIVALLRDTERWLAECRVAASGAAGEGSSWHTAAALATEGDAKELWALDRLCDCLFEKGVLVPLSKKKRLYTSDPFLPSKASISYWEPLLRHVQGSHADLPYVLCRRIVAVLLDAVDERSDPSYYMYLASWVSWAVKTWSDNSPAYANLKKDTLTILMKGLGYNPSPVLKQSPTFTLLRCLTSGQEEFEAVTALLLRPPSQIPKTVWAPSDLEIMEARQAQLLSLSSIRSSDAAPPSPPISVDSPAAAISIPGWRLLQDQKDWRSCPIGVYVN